MDDQTILNQFEELENKLGTLISVCKNYEKENIELKTKIETLEEEVRGKVAAENNYRQEREQIRSKVNNLIRKFDEIDGE